MSPYFVNNLFTILLKIPMYKFANSVYNRTRNKVNNKQPESLKLRGENKMFARFDENRTYGVEIEVIRGDYTQASIAAAIRSKGVSAESQGYNHYNSDITWKVITDSSCGLEVVSPILKGRAGLEQINLVCEAMNELGCKVNKTCGLHVHHDASDFEVRHIQNLFTLYAKYEKAIDNIMPASRRANNGTYCRSLIGLDYESFIERTKKYNDKNEMINGQGSRYFKLNLQSILRHGTIEFRQHSGTTDAQKITNWVILTQLMMTKAKGQNINSKKMENKKSDNYDTIVALMWTLGLYRKATRDEGMFEVAKFFAKREEDFTATGRMRTGRVA